ncbi:MAG: gamma-glutamyltransferase [Caldilineaceae bacterium]|nr:gamma-glutamyltransferase [Caldilineaceae bacterium]
MGGNAADAAVAAAFASFVAEVALVNIGGSGVALVVDSRSDHDTSYDFFSDMPTGVKREEADFQEVLIDFGPEQQAFHIGRASVAVPGAVAGLCAMAEEYGTLPLSTLLKPATRLATEGVILSPQQEYAYRILQPIFRKTPELAAIYVPDGRPFQSGERIFFPQLGRTLEQLGQLGPALFYTGAMADAILADQQARGGLVTRRDLADYAVRTSSPISVAYRDHTVMLPPPSSAGGVLIGFALRLLAPLQVGALEHNGFDHVRLLAETMRLTNLARAGWDASPLAESERIAWFLGEAHVDLYRRRLAGILHGDSPPTEPLFAPGPSDTTHISVVDGNGLLVSVTTSAGENAGFVVGDTGVCLNNMLGEEDLHPRGFHRHPAGTRLATMMTPVVVVRNERPVLAVGSGGSNRIRSAILQTLSNVLDFGLPLEDAVTAARIHFEATVLQAEGGVGKSTVERLAAAGYRVNHWPGANMFFGGAHAVAMQDGRLTPVGDPRRGGAAVQVG